MKSVLFAFALIIGIIITIGNVVIVAEVVPQTGAREEMEVALASAEIVRLRAVVIHVGAVQHRATALAVARRYLHASLRTEIGRAHV